MAAGGAPQFASLYVGDLHPDVTEAMLYEIFNSVGPVASIRVCRDSVSRRSLGYGYVNFHSVQDAERALDTLNYSSIKGRACRIMWSQRDPSLRKSGAGNVFVKNLDRGIDNKALYDTFSLFGNILSCKVATRPNGKSLGYGFVHYETEDAAKQAIERVNGMQIGEKTVEVGNFMKRGDRDVPTIENFTNIYAKNFPNDFDDEKLKELFASFGNITSSVLTKDPKGRFFAFVNYDSSDAAKKAVADLNRKDIRSEDQKKEDKEAGKEDNEATDGHPSYLLYVGRAQAKWERQRELKEKFDTSTNATPARASGVNLYVKNLDESTDDASLKALFEAFGTITSCVAMKDEKGQCKGFGFVSFASPDEATKAVTEMHLKVVKGKPLYVGLAEKKEARQERLRQRYQPGMGGGKEGKGFGKDKGSGKGGMDKGFGKGYDKGFGMQQNGMGGSGMGCMGGCNPQMGMYGMQGMMGKGMGGPGMQGMMGKGMMGGPGMQGGPPMGKGMPGQQMMGGPQMMGKPGMMGQQMMGMPGKGMMNMGGKGMPMGGMPGMMGPGMMMGGPGQMRPPMPGMPQQGPGPARPMGPPGQQPQQPQQQQQMASGPGQPLTAATLAAAPPSVQKQMIGEKLYPALSKFQPELAGKITGMMLEMDNSELLMLLESEQQLKVKCDEAMRVLESSRG